MRARGIRLPDPIIEFYEKEAKETGTNFGDRVRRVLEQHMKYRKKYDKEGK
jgi:hypothetical protein